MAALFRENTEVEGTLGVKSILWLLKQSWLFLPCVGVFRMNCNTPFLALLRHLLLALNLLPVDEVRVGQQALDQALRRDERDESKAARLCK